uniref:Uncharacterized protein n=1 Tax=Capra hircus TaxID=9925 RepID=A0A8C2RJN0_CAPHI
AKYTSSSYSSISEKQRIQSKKWEEHLNRHFSKENLQMAKQPPSKNLQTEPTMTSGVSRLPGAMLTTARKAPQGPPEIYSDTAFPSLQSTAKHIERRKY